LETVAAMPVNSSTMPLTQVVLSVLIFIVMFLGIGFLLNMLLRMTWLMAVVYPIIVILIIDEVRFFEYFTKPKYSFQLLGEKFLALQPTDIMILSSGMVGAIIAGIISKVLRKQGYQMF